jgi:hypothetical protein
MNKIDEKIDKYLVGEEKEKATTREKNARKMFLKDWGLVNKYVNNINKYVIKKGSWGFLEGTYESLKHLINYNMGKYVKDVLDDSEMFSGLSTKPHYFGSEQQDYNEWEKEMDKKKS